jgi:hypothetical protein
MGCFQSLGASLNFFKGFLDEVKIFNTSLTSAEVQQMFQAYKLPALYNDPYGNISFPTIAGKTYHLQRTEDFTSWQDQWDPILGTGNAFSFSIMTNLSNKAFYKLRVEQ